LAPGAEIAARPTTGRFPQLRPARPGGFNHWQGGLDDVRIVTVGQVIVRVEAQPGDNVRRDL